jgi:predicted unusual protein kinase regulating ubiquinone biosynthesis (AarF/ABC1/UbiB family)
MSETHKQFEQEFGRKIYEVFEFFNEQPVASASIA